jgi:hypothetical protein
MPNYRHTFYGPGTLAYVDAYGTPLIPCKVEAVAPDGSEVKVKLTATRGAFKRGEVLTRRQSDIIPRDKVRTVDGMIKIIPHFQWLPDITTPANLHLGPCAEGVAPGDAMYVKGAVGIVQSITIHPRGHNLAPIKSEYLALEVTTTAGRRVLGATDASIGSDLAVHYKIDKLELFDADA